MTVDDSETGVAAARPGTLDRVRPMLGSFGPALAILVAQLVFLPVSSGLFVRGLIIGALSALIALGMALVYRANRIINFAQAEMGFVPAVLAYLLMKESGWPYLLAVGASLLVAVLLGAVTERVVIRRFFRAPRLLVTIATIGLGQMFFGIAVLLPQWWDAQPFADRMPEPFRAEQQIGNVVFNTNDLLALVVAPLALIAVAAFLQRSDLGVAVRAAADSADRASLLGIPVHRLQTLVWSLASTLAFVAIFLRSGVLEVPTVGAAFSLRVLFNALVALLLGRMTNLVGVTSAAVALGVLERGITDHYGDELTEPILGLILVVVLLARRREMLGRPDPGEVATWHPGTSEVRPVPKALAHLREVRFLRWACLGAVGVFAVVLPWFLSNSQIFKASALLIYGLLGVSLVLLSGWGGIISLGHVAYFAVGSAVAGWAMLDLGVDLFPAMLLATVAGAAVATLVGVPGARLRGIYLAVSSFGFALATTSYLLDQSRFDWVPDERVGRPALLGGLSFDSQRGVYYLALVMLALAIVAARNIRRTRFGRALVALRDNDRAAQACAVDAIRVRLAAFALSGAMAGLAGALFMYHQQRFRPASYGAVQNLEVFTMVVVGGMTTATGAVLGAVWFRGTQWFLTSEWQQLLTYGVGVVAVLLVFPNGLAGVVYRIRDRILRAVATARRLELGAWSRTDVSEAPAPPPAETTTGGDAGGAVQPAADEDRGPALLDVRHVEAAYDGVPVLFGVDLQVRDGEAVALLGTNGAGKSTLLRTVSGLLDPTAGRITFAGEDIAGRAPHRVAARGVLQMPGGQGIFPGLTVAENLRVAGWLHRRDRAASVAALERVEQLFPVLAERRTARAGDLSGGQQQMLALGMALLSRPRLLMIDELSLGLAPAVVAELLHVVDGLRDEGTTLLVVEQSVNVALEIADRAVFMEHGTVRFDGPAAELLDRPDLLRSVFLGHVAPGRTAGLSDRERSEPSTVSDGATVLSTRDLRVAFGGVAAVDGVSLDVHRREIVAVIGPNGAGKTTLFDLISGFVPADRGSVVLAGADVTRSRAASRARCGLGRSFQDARLFPSLTVDETVAAACERWVDVGDPLSAMFHLPNAQDSELAIRRRVDELVELLGLGAFRSSFVAELSTGTRRVVDLACLLAQRPAVVLLDEPAAGIAQREVEQLPPLIRRIRDDLDASVVLVEHDIPLVEAVADRVVALDRGRVIATGPTADVLADPAVVAAYMGDDARATNRSSPDSDRQRM